MSIPAWDPVVDIMKALSEPIRFDIMARIVSVPELPCTTLEKELPISKSTISYHMKILHHAGLIDIRKDGRYYHYRVRSAEIEQIFPGLVEQIVARGKPSTAGLAPAAGPTSQLQGWAR